MSRVRTPRLGLVVTTAAVTGALAVLAVALLASPGHPSDVGLPHRWLLPLLLAVTVAGELTAVRLRHGDQVEELTLFEAAVVADACLLDPREAVLVPVVAMVLASLVVRRPFVKAVFNVGTYAAAAAVLVATVALLSDPGAGFRGGATVVALLVGTLASTAVNLVGLAAVLAAAGGVPVRATLREGWRLSAVMAVGTVALGAIAVTVAGTAPLLLPFSLLPAGAITYAYAAVAQEGDERSRSQQLLSLSHLMAGAIDVEDLVTSFIALVREAFRAETAFVVLESAGREETVVVADGTGVSVRGAHPAERALLATAGHGTELLPEITTAAGQARAIIAPLDAEARRLGVVVLTEPAPARRRLSFAALTGTTERGCHLGPAEATVVGPLASALAVALRGAEHLSRLTEETDKLTQVVEHSSDGIVVLDGGGDIAVWSPAMEQTTGIPAAHALGRRLDDVVITRDPTGATVDALHAGWDLLSPATPRADLETAVVRPDGEQRWVRWAHAAVFDGTTLVRDVVLVHDITRERQVERLKSDFIATVSHELRTPITPIKGYVDLLRRKGEEFTPEKRRECLDLVGDRVAHLARIVEDLLLASRVAAPASTVEMGYGDLVALARKACGDFSVETDRLVLDLPAEPLPVACDPVRVVQVVSNMVSNALKYSPADRPVELTVRTTPGHAVLAVRDRGRGIPADQLDAVFEKFHRVEDPMRMTTGGTGLGLYIARQLAEAMAGTLEVQSSYGVGSTFTFRLPLLPAGAVVPPAAPARRGAWPPLPPRAPSGSRQATSTG